MEIVFGVRETNRDTETEREAPGDSKCTFLLQCHKESMTDQTTENRERQYGFSMSTHVDISSLILCNTRNIVLTVTSTVGFKTVYIYILYLHLTHFAADLQNVFSGSFRLTPSHTFRYKLISVIYL